MDMCLQDKIGDSEMSAVYHHVNKNCRKANGNNNNNNSNIYITNRFNNQLLPPNNSVFPSVLRLRTLGGAVGVEQLFQLRSPKVQQRLRRAFATQAHRQHRFNVRKICPGHNEMCQNLFFSHQNVQKTNFFKLVCHVSLQPEALQRLPQRRGAGHMCHGQTLDRPPQICEKKHAGSHGHCSTSSPRGKDIASGPPNSVALSIRQYWNPHGHVLFTFHKSTPHPNENPFEK